MVIMTEASELGPWSPLIPQVTAQVTGAARCTGAPVLLMDEPTSALDGESEESFGKCLTFKEWYGDNMFFCQKRILKKQGIISEYGFGKSQVPYFWHVDDMETLLSGDDIPSEIETSTPGGSCHHTDSVG